MNNKIDEQLKDVKKDLNEAEKLSAIPLPLEKQVTSRDLSERFKDLGVKQDSLWYYDTRIIGSPLLYIEDIKKTRIPMGKWFISAFTVAELSAGLPYRIKVDGEWTWLCITKTINGYETGYSTSGGFVNGYTSDIELANSLAKLKINLIENKLIHI